MSDDHDYQVAFNYVRQAFFPRWDRKREWALLEVDDLDGACGSCVTPEKRVKIVPGYSGNCLLLILIHEICHSFTTGHAKNGCQGWVVS